MLTPTNQTRIQNIMTTPRFDAFIPWILEWETEFYSDGRVRTEHDPDDPGGTTRYGIDQRSHPHVDVEHLTKDEAIEIYFNEWFDSGAEDMEPKLGEAYFNACVNAGKGRADKLMIESGGDVKKFILAQGAWYRRLADAKPSSRKYLKGWINRLNSLWDKLELDPP